MHLGGGVPIEPRPNIEAADVQSGLPVRLAWPLPGYLRGQLQKYETPPMRALPCIETWGTSW